MELLATLEDKYRLPKGLLNSVMQTESRGNINAVSPKGAQGAFQFMPATAKAYGVNTNDLASSAEGAAKMYADLLKAHNGDLDKALASYNWGQGNVSRKGIENAPKETRDYIAKVKTGMGGEQMENKQVERWIVESSPKEERWVVESSPKQPTFEEDLKAELAANPVSAKLAAAGTALTDLYQGGKQLLGVGDKREIENQRIIREANPGSAIAGNLGLYVAGGLAAPILNTAKGITATGAIAGGLAPTKGDNVAKEHLGNALIGGAAALAGYKATKGIGEHLINKKAAHELLKSQNATTDASLKAAQEAGYTIPRSQYNPTFMTNRLEGIAGKAAIKQQAAMENQSITNNLARKALDLPESTPLSISTIEKVRTDAYKPYKEVAGLSKGAENALEQLKQARAEANGWFNAYNRSARPDDLAKAKELQAVADIAENVIDDYAKAAGKKELFNELVKARKVIAKTYTLERAMNKGTGDINARVLGRLYDKGKPLSDGLDTIGRFATTFPQISQAGASVPTAGVSALEPIAMAGYGMAGQALAGNPTGLLAAGLPLLRHPARALALSSAMQKAPSYDIGLLQKLLKAGATASYSPMALAGYTVPSFTK